MSKNLRTLADMRREEHVKNLSELSDRDLCEMIRAHFETHPALPGEKNMKDTANQVIHQAENMEQADAQASAAAALNPHEFMPAGETPFDSQNNFLTSEEKDDLVQKYAQTRIRETPLKEGNHYFDWRHFDPTALKREPLGEEPQNEGNTTVYSDRVNVELQKNDAGEVSVIAEQSDGGFRFIGHLPEKFLANNPMNVEYCSAELEVIDYSNGHMKNLSTHIVVDTDVMSGDVIDLDESLLSGLEQDNGLEQ